MSRRGCEVEDKSNRVVFIGDSVCTSFDIDWNRLLLNAQPPPPPRALKPRKELLDAETRL